MLLKELFPTFKENKALASGMCTALSIYPL